MSTNGPRQTEERLRYHLDSNQVMRERLCLAVMPLIGPYTRERPRRPKGGPDGGRDIEAIHEGSTVVWGAVGFRNGGGNDDQARRDASTKFENDLGRALEENPTLQGFVFFTNVDLTPSIVERLKEKAAEPGITVVDIVDIERLRHALDSPEGLIARLQYLDIPMSATEQIALVNKFGTQLQNAVATRFDRVERTLSQMERFLDFQKPLYRLDVFIALEGRHHSSEIGTQGLLLKIGGLQDLGKTVTCLLWNMPDHQHANANLVTQAHLRKTNCAPLGSGLVYCIYSVMRSQPWNNVREPRRVSPTRSTNNFLQYTKPTHWLGDALRVCIVSVIKLRIRGRENPSVPFLQCRLYWSVRF